MVSIRTVSYTHLDVYKRQVFASEEGKALLKKWGVEGDYEGIGHCGLGYPTGDVPKAKPRKENYVYHVD